MARVVFLLLFLLPLLSNLLLNVKISTAESGENGKMRQNPITFFWHNTAGGPDPSVVEVARSATLNPTNFGTIRVMDDPLTITADHSSFVIGKCQGIYISADKTTAGLFMAMTITFTAGEYAGSSFTVVGRNTVRTPEREMPITGGTGLLQYAKGYVRVQTTSQDPTIGHTVAEYKCYFNTSPNNVLVAE